MVATVVGIPFALIPGVHIISRIGSKIINPLSSSLKLPSEVFGHGEIFPLFKGS